MLHNEARKLLIQALEKNRKAKVRLLEKLPDVVRAAFKTISSHDCSGWFRFCSYSR